MNVLGLPLPPLLQELIEQGRWRRPADVTVLKQITGSQYAEDFAFLDVEGMRSQSRPVHLVEDPRYAAVYSLASSVMSGEPITDDGILDIDQSIFIAVNWDEEAICLDYRFFRDNPRVVVSIWEDVSGIKWRAIAPDFESFAAMLGL